MTAKVVGQSGKSVEVATLDDIASGTDLPIASSTVLGGVTVGTNITVDSTGKISIPYANPSTYGLVKIGSNVSATDGVIRVPTANRATAGVVKTGSTLSFSPDGTIDVYTAKSTSAGIVSQGDNVSISDAGVLSVPIADYESPGVMSKGAPVDDTQTIEVTDINSAANAIAAIGTTLTQLQNSLRDAGIIVKPD